MPNTDHSHHGDESDLVSWNPEFGPEAQDHMEELRATIEPLINITQQLPGILNMSPTEFQLFMEMDEFADLPAGLPRPTLTISKLIEVVAAKGGTLTLEITIDGHVIRIPK